MPLRSPLFHLVTAISLLLGSVYWQANCFAREIIVKTKSGEQLNIETFPARGNQAIIWTPSGFGVQPPQAQAARQLVKEHLETWIADLHSSYFLARGRASVEQFPARDISELIDQVHKTGKSEIYLMSSGRGAIAALRAARYWQEHHAGNKTLRGVILFHPSMYANRPAIGEQASYLPIVHSSNIPIFIIQPQLSTTYTRLPRLLTALREGGSQVFVQTLPNVKDGFHLRPKSDLDPDDLKAKKQINSYIVRAIKMLEVVPLQEVPAPAVTVKEKKPDTKPGLTPYNGKLKYPALDLKDITGVGRKLSDLKGKVVLVSFWASWCPPCIREIPSMNSLYGKLDRKKFEILAVNVGESRTATRKFLRQQKVDFPVLLDLDKKFYLDWNVYVVPSNFIIDKNGKLVAGSVGAIDWQSKDIVKKIKELLN